MGMTETVMKEADLLKNHTAAAVNSSGSRKHFLINLKY